MKSAESLSGEVLSSGHEEFLSQVKCFFDSLESTITAINDAGGNEYTFSVPNFIGPEFVVRALRDLDYTVTVKNREKFYTYIKAEW